MAPLPGDKVYADELWASQPGRLLRLGRFGRWD
jgi:hypothetical protein